MWSDPTAVSVVIHIDPDPRPYSTVLSAQKLHACARGIACVWYDAVPLVSIGPAPRRGPLNLPRTMLGMRKDENKRGFLPYL